MERSQLAIPDLVAALESSSAQLGPYDPRTITVANRLAIAFWHAGGIDQAINLLDQALDRLAVSGSEHPIRADVLCTLGEILIEHEQWERAGAVMGEVLDLCIRRFGESHPSSIAAMGDLSSVLFESGNLVEATRLQSEAVAYARVHLGKEHPVSSVLEWNRVRRSDDLADAETAKRILIDDLLWLLSADEMALDEDQQTIREMVAERLNWNTAGRC
jgi:tetratricopeptide (TPR) repeat protein